MRCLSWSSVILVSSCVLSGCGGGASDSATPPPAAPPPSLVAPSITQQPIPLAVDEGGSATFSVSAAGTAPLAYQWRRNGQAIDGATQSSLTMPATAFYDGGARFSAVVSNAAGQVVSSDAELTVRIRPKLALCSTAFVVRADGTVWSWGANERLTLGRGSTNPANQPTPQQIPGLADVVTIACGFGHALALLRDGSVRAWGYNSNGQLGDGTRVNRAAPVAVAGLTDVVALAAGLEGSYALRRDGTLWMWGVMASKALFPGATVPADPAARLAPVQLTTPEPMRALAVRYQDPTDAGLVVGRSGQVYFFGRDLRSMSGIGFSESAVQVGGLTSAISVVVGIDTAGALRADGSVWVWGSSRGGQFGDGQTGPNLFSSQPRQVPGLPVISALSFNSEHLIAIDANATMWSWGANGYGELGRPTNPNAPSQAATPTLVATPTDVETVVAGAVANSMAMTRDGRIWSWGYNFSGTLGVPYSQTIAAEAPTLVSGVTGR